MRIENFSANKEELKRLKKEFGKHGKAEVSHIYEINVHVVKEGKEQYVLLDLNVKYGDIYSQVQYKLVKS